jgi:NOL1/NOP2/fmu family ribosome biogenesis protein
LTGYSPLSNDLQRTLESFFEDIYEFDFKNSLETFNLVPFRKIDQIYLLPQAYLSHFETLPWNAIAMPLGRFIRDRFEPSVDFILKFGNEFAANVWTLPNEKVLQWMKGFDMRGIDLPGYKTGTIIAMRDQEGNNLGAAKYSTKRLRNLLPNRNLMH